jgi:diaminopimelate decarboxylase
MLLVCRLALSAGVAVNLDNFQELQRTADLLASEPGLIAQQQQQQQLIGLRINPQVFNTQKQTCMHAASWQMDV